MVSLESSTIAEPVASAGVRQLHLVWDGGHRRVVLPQVGTLVFGRAEGCDIRIDHPSVSRHHCQLELGPPLRVMDLGSANGTRVGAFALVKGDSVELPDGSTISLGGVRAFIDAPKSPWAEIEPNPARLCLPAGGKLAEAFTLLTQFARGSLPVLVLGETGTGKELAVEWVHAGSSRREQPLVRLNCAARCLRHCSRASCSAMNAARSRAPRRRDQDCSRSPMAAPSISTSSGSFH